MCFPTSIKVYMIQSQHSPTSPRCLQVPLISAACSATTSMASGISFFLPLSSVISPATRNPRARAASPSSLHPKLSQLTISSERSILGVNQPQFFNDLRRHRLSIDLSSRATENKSSDPELVSPLDTVLTFYEAINLQDYRKVEELVSDDCHFQDMAFAKPFEGKKKVSSFLKELGSSMGSNVKLVVEDEYRSCGQSMVILAWHLEWRGKNIPFTRAHSFFECEADGKGQKIKKVRVLMEWPLKLGDLALRLLKAVTSLFERFPEPAERFLQNPYAPIAWLLKIYNTFIDSVVWPAFSQVILFYTKLWNAVLFLASYLYVILLKFFQP